MKIKQKQTRKGGNGQLWPENMVIYLSGISTEENILYIKEKISLSFWGDILFGDKNNHEHIIKNIKPINQEISNEFLKTIIPDNMMAKILDIKTKEIYSIVKLEVILEDVSEQEFYTLLSDFKKEDINGSKNTLNKAVKSARKYFFDVLANNNQYLSEFKEDKGCLENDKFLDYENISNKQLKEISKLPCLFDSRMLVPEINSEEYADGCVNYCAKAVLDCYPDIEKRIIARYLKYINNGTYQSSIHPQLITDKEMEYINHHQTQIFRSLEKRFKIKSQELVQTIQNKKENAIIFNGNNLNPLPMELFNLWRQIFENYKYPIEHFKPDVFDFSKWEIIPFDSQVFKSFTHYEEYTDNEESFIFPFNSSVIISLYTNEKNGKEIFYFAIQASPIDSIEFKNKNQIILPADNYLKNIYYYWKTFKEENKNKYNKEYNNHKKINTNISQIDICNTCIYSKACERKNCYLSKEDFDFLINKNNKFNLYVHKFGSPLLSINEWKQIIDNLINVVDIYQFNICGDEPLLFSGLEELTDYITSFGIKCSLETTGLFLSNEWLKKNIKYYDEIVISVDSFDTDACVIIGKVNKDEESLSKEDIATLINNIKILKAECTTSIETKIMQINKQEIFSKNIKNLECLPDVWKIKKYEVRDRDFDYFMNRNFEKNKDTNLYEYIPGLEIKIEDITDNYTFIDNNGILSKRKRGKTLEIINIATETFIEDIKKNKINIFEE